MTRGFYPVVLACMAGALACIPFHAAGLAAAFFVVGILALAVEDLRALLVLAFPLYGLGGALASVVLIEGGAYISEQFRFGFNIGASGGLAAYSLAFIGLAHFGVTAALRSVRAAQLDITGLKFVIVTGCLGMAAFFAVVFARYGTAFGYTDLRFGWGRSLPPLVEDLYLSTVFLIPTVFGLAGFVWAYTRRLHGWFVVLALPVVAQVLTGEKFSGFASSLTMGLTGAGVAWYLRGHRISVRPAALVWAGGVAAALLASVLVGYRNLRSGDLLASLSNRIVLQGHVWFGIFDQFAGRPSVGVGELVRETTLDRPGGLDYLSLLISNPSYVQERLARGVTFTMGGPPSALAAFGLAGGLVIYGALGLGFVLIARLLATSLGHGRVVAAGAAMLYFMVLVQMTQMGRWDVFYGPAAIACYAVFAAGALWRYFQQPPRASVREAHPAPQLQN